MSILPDAPGTRHVLQISISGYHLPIYVGTSCKETQLELFNVVRSALHPNEQNLTHDTDVDRFDTESVNSPRIIYCDQLQTQDNQSMPRWWMT